MEEKRKTSALEAGFDFTYQLLSIGKFRNTKNNLLSTSGLRNKTNDIYFQKHDLTLAFLIDIGQYES